MLIIMRHFKFILFLVLFVFLLIVLQPTRAASICDTVTEIPESECLALEALYNSTDGDNWTDNTNWLVTNTPSTWFSVEVNNGHVTVLCPYDNGLSGTLPPELGNLTALREFCLGRDSVSGPLPATLGNLSNLIYMNVSECQLSGNIPATFGGLTSLQEMYLFNNTLEGPIPAQLGNLSELTVLQIRFNALTGTVPASFVNLTKLQDLNLGHNQLSGTIPKFLGSMTSLQLLKLYENQFTGSIPPELGNLSNLQILYLYDNDLTGPIPPALGNLSQLQYITVHGNQLTGTIPAELGNLSSLTHLHLGENQLSGTIPPELGNLGALESLSLYQNQLTGSIPAALCRLTNLSQMLLSKSQLTGSIPYCIGNLVNLKLLWLSNNALSGEIPPSITRLVNLNADSAEHTDLGYNMLTVASLPGVVAFLNDKDPDWAETQTIVPGNIAASVVSDTSVQITWTPIPYTADGGYYEVTYSTDFYGPYTPGCQTADKSETGCTVSDLAPGTEYVFAVRTYTPAHDEQQNDLWTSLYKTAPLPPSPALVGPPDKSETSQTPELSWEAVSNAALYYVEIARAPEFSYSFRDYFTSSTSLTPDPLGEGFFYWRVHGINKANQSGEWSEVRSIKTSATALLGPPRRRPLAGAILTSATPRFRWGQVPKASTYHFQVAADPDFAIVVIDETLDQPVYTSLPLLPGIYYWRVAVVDAAGNHSAWSEVWDFTLAADTAVTPPPTSEPPATNVPPTAAPTAAPPVLVPVEPTQPPPPHKPDTPPPTPAQPPRKSGK